MVIFNKMLIPFLLFSMFIINSIIFLITYIWKTTLVLYWMYIEGKKYYNFKHFFYLLFDPGTE